MMIRLNRFLEKCDDDQEVIIHTARDRKVCITVADALELFRQDFLWYASIECFDVYDGYETIEIWLEGSNETDEADEADEADEDR